MRRATFLTTLESSTTRQDFMDATLRPQNEPPHYRPKVKTNGYRIPTLAGLCGGGLRRAAGLLGLRCRREREHVIVDADLQLHVGHARQDARIERLDAPRVD